MRVDITKLITLTSAARLLDMPREFVQFYNYSGRFVKKYIIDGHPFYNKDEVAKWRPKSLPEIKREMRAKK